MNPIVSTITTILIAVNRLIDSLGHRTVEAIKAGFFVLIFLLMAMGGILGYRSGMDNAQIKSPPLIQSTNESFELDIKRESRGQFSSVLESKLITEMKSLEPGKVNYPANDAMMPEADRGIIEPDETSKFRTMPDSIDMSGTVDSIPANPDVSGVRPITRDFSQAETPNDIFTDMKNLKDTGGNTTQDNGKKSKLKPLNRGGSTEPGMIEKDRGVIE